jgi:hypothetical protein
MPTQRGVLLHEAEGAEGALFNEVEQGFVRPSFTGAWRGQVQHHLVGVHRQQRLWAVWGRNDAEHEPRGTAGVRERRDHEHHVPQVLHLDAWVSGHALFYLTLRGKKQAARMESRSPESAPEEGSSLYNPTEMV